MTLLLLALVLVLAVALFLGYRLSRQSAELAYKTTSLDELAQKHQRQEQELQGLRAQLQTSLQDSTRLEEQRRLFDDVKAQLEALQRDYAHSQSLLGAQREEIRQLTRQLEEAKREQSTLNEGLKESFRNLATEVLKDQRSELDARAQESLEPLRNQLKEFREKVDSVYEAEAIQRLSLKEEITKLIQRSEDVSKETTQLTQALKGNTKVQGNWGEMILENILERSGLRKGEEYFLQERQKDEEGKDLIPDVLVRYPNGGTLIIDSKVSLRAYLRYLNAETDEERELAAKDHLRDVRNHIEELSRKDYRKHVQGASNFVMLFVPNEPAYVLAVKSDPNLWEYAYRKNIVLINGTNLIASLRLTQDLWQRERQSQNVEKILGAVAKLYDKFASYAETFVDIEKKLNQINQSYEKAKRQLLEGPGNVHRQLEGLRKLGVEPTKRLPESWGQSDESDLFDSEP